MEKMRPRVGIKGQEHYMKKQNRKGMAVGKPREYLRASQKSKLTKHRIRELHSASNRFCTMYM